LFPPPPPPPLQTSCFIPSSQECYSLPSINNLIPPCLQPMSVTFVPFCAFFIRIMITRYEVWNCELNGNKHEHALANYIHCS
jgi:hypothetical protein